MIAQQERLRDAYNELKYTAPDKVEAMRDQEMIRLKMSLAYRTGSILTIDAPSPASSCSKLPYMHSLQLLPRSLNLLRIS